MRIYDRDRDESLIVAWYFSLKSDPVEFSNLFMKPLRNLTHLLLWAERDVKVMFEEDADGIWACSWAEPYGSDAFFGSWIRKDKRGTFSALAFIRRCYRLCFEHFHAIIGITKQPNLDKLHLALGYRFVGEFSTLFDGSPARVYELDRKAFYERRSSTNSQARANGRAILDTVGNGDGSSISSDQGQNGNRKSRRLAASSGNGVVRQTGESGRLVRGKQDSSTGDVPSSSIDAASQVDRSPKRRRTRQPSKQPSGMHAESELSEH